jgi:hypothetical protein
MLKIYIYNIFISDVIVLELLEPLHCLPDHPIRSHLDSQPRGMET